MSESEIDIRITTCQAENTVPVTQEISRYLSRRFGVKTEFVIDIPWRRRYQQLDSGQIEMGWICGLPYVLREERPAFQLELLAAPVMEGDRYQSRPVYFSDVIVHADSRFHTFADLKGTAWSFNEPDSQSGFGITRYHLATIGEDWTFFSKVIEAGSHRASLRMVLNGEIHASAIDSTFLEWILQRHPEIQNQIRVVDTLGPSMIPPWVIATSVPEDLRLAVQRALLEMHANPDGRAILGTGQLAKFVKVTDQDYDPIRRMKKISEHLVL